MNGAYVGFSCAVLSIFIQSMIRRVLERFSVYYGRESKRCFVPWGTPVSPWEFPASPWGTPVSPREFLVSPW